MKNEGAARDFFLKDPLLSATARKLGPLGLDIYGKKGHFMALVEAVISQQLSGKAAAAIYGKFEKFLDKKANPEKFLSKIDPSELQELGISRSKSECIIAIAKMASKGGLDRDKMTTMDDAEMTEELTKIKGVGLWTVHMFLIFGLKREDVWPAGDYGIRKNLTRLLNKKELLDAAEVVKIGEKWKPFRSYASCYIWNS